MARVALRFRNKLTQRVRFDDGIIVKQPHKIGALKQRVLYTYVVAPGESQVGTALNKGEFWISLAYPLLGIINGGVINHDNLVMVIGQSFQGCEALEGMFKAVPVENNDKNFGRVLHSHVVRRVLPVALFGFTKALQTSHFLVAHVDESSIYFGAPGSLTTKRIFELSPCI